MFLKIACADEKNETPLPDTAVNKLGFPQRAITAFKSEKINTLNELLAFNEDDLFALPNVGKTALAKVLSILKEFGLELGHPIEDKSVVKSLPKDQPNSEEKLGPNDPVSKLKLSVRAFNSLQSVNIKTIGQLARLNIDELLEIPNLGRIAIEQIQRIFTQTKVAKPKLEGTKKNKTGSSSATRITFNQRPNVAVKSNVWIDKYSPAKNFFAASHESNLEKVKKVIPGDYMIDFINSENPLQDPTNVSIIGILSLLGKGLNILLIDSSSKEVRMDTLKNKTNSEKLPTTSWRDTQMITRN